MASHSNQYIFGEFSPDEFNQFFVTPRCYVELPPFNDKITCSTQSSGDDCQRIEFGVGEVMDVDLGDAKDARLKVSSTLNPQAPEFILGCQSLPKLLQASDQPGSTRCNNVGCPATEVSSLGGVKSHQDLNGAPGSLGQRERRKKKKRPPGYYNYLEGSEGVTSECCPDGPLELANGHGLSAPDLPDLGSEDGGTVTRSDPTHCDNVDGSPPSSAPNIERTCESPDELSMDLTPGSASFLDSNNVASSSSSSSSHSSRAAEGARTAEQRLEPPASESPELPDSGRHSPSPTSPPPPLTPTACPGTTLSGDEENGSNPGVVNGLADLSVGADGQEDSSEAVQQLSLSQYPGEPPLPADAEARAPSPPAAPPVPVSQPPKSWASLFHNPKPSSGNTQVSVEVKSTVPVTAPVITEPVEKAEELKEGPVPISEDPLAPRLAELIEHVKLIHKPVSLQPRGLVNKGNWCYINATLQALIACPPMYHLMKSIAMLSETPRQSTSTPMIDNFVRLVNEFSNMPVPSRAKQLAAGDKMTKDIRPGVPFEPDYIYKLLTVIKSSLSEKGRQEDAEEYLGFILNGLHEEMQALKRLLSPQEDKAPSLNGPECDPAPEEAASGKENDSEDEWEQVGPRNKTSVTRQADFVRTPITDIFGGHIRSVVYQQSSKESATLQPFFTLQLDIQSEKVRTVQDALESLVVRESVQGYTSKTKQEIEISRRVTLEELPPVLVLHLKRFVFEKTGGCQKLIKTVEYPIDLEISKDLLSPSVRSKILKGQRTYRLFAVVYHHGNSATGGHYTTDVFHIGLNGWLRIDDQAVKVVGQYQVLKQTAERTAYLLYYRRVDLL